MQVSEYQWYKKSIFRIFQFVILVIGLSFYKVYSFLVAFNSFS